jgi:hypothetical protein
MSELKRLVISSEETAASALDYFNGFHDGFMKRIVVESRDRIDEDQSQSCTGLFDVHIDFAHYNYADGAEPFHPHNQIVRAEFRDVQDILFDFQSGYLGNTIIGFSIVAASRGRLELRLSRHCYLEGERRHELREMRLITFREAVFAEQAAGT